MDYGSLILFFLMVASVVIAYLVKEHVPNLSIWKYFAVLFGCAIAFTIVYTQVANYIAGLKSPDLSAMNTLHEIDQDVSSPPTNFEVTQDMHLKFRLPHALPPLTFHNLADRCMAMSIA